jgi:DNA helicase II / ATP-dependent DNA helicase PcrA
MKRYNASDMGKISPEDRKLNKNQHTAVVHGSGPLLIIAGAGTGKTTVVTERIKYLLSSGKAKPEEILALTFTEKASREMEQRVEKALPYGTTHMWISTFHAFCDRILKAEAINIGLDSSYTLMTEAETIQFFRTHLFSFPLEYYRPLGNPTKFIRGLIQHFSRLKDEDISPSAYAEWVKKNTSLETEDKKRYEELSRAYKTYEELKIKHCVADYSDLISWTLQLFRQRKNVLARYQKQFKYLLVDEFQDTNFAQNELAVLLAGKKKNITVVGDDDQAIYRWRGAAISNIIQFRKRFPKAKIVVLTQNYRSTRAVLDSSYTLIQNNNPDRLEIVEHIDKKLKSVRDLNGAPVSVLYADRVENEAEMVAGEIEKIRKNFSETISWSDIAILVRANAYAEPFTRAFARKGIPYQFLGPGQLFRQAEVKDLIAYLMLLSNFEDSVAAYRVLTLDVLGIHPRDIASVISFARKNNISAVQVCERISGYGNVQDILVTPEISQDGKTKITSFIRMFHKHLGLIKKETAGQIMYYFLQESGLLKQFASYKTQKEEKAASNIAKFFDKLKSYETDHEDASVFAVCEWITLSMDIGESPQVANMDWTENDAVNIMTVHSSKGLEFPVVFLVNLVGARFPTMDKKEQIPLPDELVKEVLPVGDSHIEEERRLFYVGMTRARDMLYLTAAQYYGEGKREKKVSPFIVEAIGEERYAKEMIPVVSQMANQLPLITWEKVEEKDGVPVRNPVTYLSYTQLSTFTTCPLQYKYRYILRIPVPTSAALVFGDTIHKTLCSFYEKVQNKEKPNVVDLLAIYEKQWQTIGYGGRMYEEKMKSRGVDLLQEFYKKGYDPENIPKSLEQPFKIRITPTLFLGGKIDRVDEKKDGTLEIIDYKTGQAPKTKNVGADEQLTSYALAACDSGLYNMSPDKVIVTFYFLEGNTKVSATRTKDQVDQMRQTIMTKAEEISVSEFHPTPGKHCDFCEFKLICEAWN